jgi:hypothetical protein
MRTVALALALLFAVTAAKAQDVRSIDIVEHGLYTSETDRTEKQPNGMGHSFLKNICHVGTTDRVPLRLGAQFGFRYRVNGAREGQIVELRKTTIFPAPLTPPGFKPVPASEYVFNRQTGNVSYAGYGFDHDWELVPGTWTFQLWHKARKLAEIAFEIREGRQDPPTPSTSELRCFQVSALTAPQSALTAPQSALRAPHD